ncbi:related to YKE2 - Gim complex component [Melanopsichium pennsylvanicum]|uniref:Related to YKE2 - Gim complex component n=1 Tax=Melanopsichium pennsylvanicum TaxID=63383 RepID=A0AAJ5C351_9BASI|nr:related to YKE2 - Gim complex component [Melanopsichium pennsylvanicum]
MEAAVAEYQKLQGSFQTAVEARQALDSQLRENNQVSNEFRKLTQNNQVYKLIGPVLVKQDQIEAKTNVDKRIEFIKDEITRVETQIKDLTDKTEKKKNHIVALQQQQAKQQHVVPAPSSV